MGRTACTQPLCLYKGDLYLYVFFSRFPVLLLLFCTIDVMTVNLEIEHDDSHTKR